MLLGRDFTEAGVAPNGPPLVIVDQALAAHLWSEENPLGKRIKYGAADQTRWPWMEVIGVVGNTHHFSLDDYAEKALINRAIRRPSATQAPTRAP